MIMSKNLNPSVLVLSLNVVCRLVTPDHTVRFVHILDYLDGPRGPVTLTSRDATIPTSTYGQNTPWQLRWSPTLRGEVTMTNEGTPPSSRSHCEVRRKRVK